MRRSLRGANPVLYPLMLYFHVEPQAVEFAPFEDRNDSDRGHPSILEQRRPKLGRSKSLLHILSNKLVRAR